MNRGDNEYKVLVLKPEGKDHLGDLSVDGRIILKWLFKKYGARVLTELN
jgi:hypothetical protein